MLRRRLETVDLPVAMEPVRPRRSIVAGVERVAKAIRMDFAELALKKEGVVVLVFVATK